MKATATLAVCVGLLLLACAPVASDPVGHVAPVRAAVPTALIGVQWRLVDGLGGLEDEAEITLSFEADRLQGSGGCNRYSADYRFDAGALEVGPVVATKRGCAGPGGSAEPQFFEALDSARRLRTGDDMLHIDTEDGPLVFRRGR